MKIKIWTLLCLISLVISGCNLDQPRPTPDSRRFNTWIDAPLNGDIIPLEPYTIVYHGEDGGFVLDNEDPSQYKISINGVAEIYIDADPTTDPVATTWISYGEYEWTPPAPGKYTITIGKWIDGLDAVYDIPAEITVYVAQPEKVADNQMPPQIELSPTMESATLSTSVPPAEESADCDVAQFVEDVTIPDGTAFEYGEGFTKTWRLRNIGSCPWTRAYELVFFSGERLSGLESQAFVFDSEVAPGQTINISVDLVAPRTDGNYVGYWKLKNSGGDIFGLSNGNPIYVEINVPETSSEIESPVTAPEITLLTPDFSIEYAGSWSCTNPKAYFRIENTGNVAFESLIIELQGPPGTHIDGGTQHYPFRDPPPPASDCALEGNQFLNPGEVAWVHIGNASVTRGITTGRVIIKICTNANLGGLCVEKILDYDW